MQIPQTVRTEDKQLEVRQEDWSVCQETVGVFDNQIMYEYVLGSEHERLCSTVETGETPI